MEENKMPLPEPPKPPEQPEVPEEGFVPYCAEAEKDGKKPNVKLLVLLLLLLLVIAGVVVISFSRKHNFYQKTMSSLLFDCRNGEQMGTPEEEILISDAETLAAEAPDSQVHIHANLYVFDEQENMEQVVTQYVYSYNTNEEEAYVKMGTPRWFGSKEQHYRYRSDEGFETEKGGKFQKDDNAYFPPLFSYCFGVESDGAVTYKLRQRGPSHVNGKTYDCEIWLMCDKSGGEPVYITLYRYYDNGRLTGVRVLNSLDTQIQVYDIQSYQFT